MTTRYVKGRLYKLETAALRQDKINPRKYMDPMTLTELTASVKRFGVLTPILFTTDEDGAPVVVDGHRRVKAAEAAGLKTVPAVFTDGDTRLQAFVGNLQREDLLPVDEAEEMAAIMKEYALNQYQLADAIGKSQATVSNTLAINRLPEDVKNAARTNRSIPKSVLTEIASLRTEASMRRKFQRYMESFSKTPRTSAKKERPSPARQLINAIDDLTGRIETAPWGDWNDDDREDFANALMGIARRAGETLAAMDRPLPGEGDEEAPRDTWLA